MIKQSIFIIVFFALPLVASPKIPSVEVTGPLNEVELRTLVSGNTLIGNTVNSNSLYELYFDPNGTLYFRKNSNNKEFHVGTWWITEDVIHSKWPTYEKKPTENAMNYYHLYKDSYLIYNVNDACGKAGTFCLPFISIKGKHSFVDEAFKDSKK